MSRLEQLRRFVGNEIVDLGIPEGALSPEDMRRTRIISLSSVGVCVVVGVPSSLHLLQLGLVVPAALLIVAVVAAALNLVALRRWQQPRAAAHAGMFILASFLVTSHTFTGGFYDPTFSWLYVLPLTAAALIDMRGAAQWTAITIGITVAFWLLPDFGIVLTSQVPEASQPGNALFNRIMTICTIGILGVSFVAGQRKAERQLAAANREVLAETSYVQLLMHAAVAANEAESFESAMRDSMHRICETMDWMAGHIYFVGEDDSIGTSGIVHSHKGQLSELHTHPRLQRHEKGVGIVGQAVEQGRTQIVEIVDTREGPDSATAIALRNGVRSGMAVPVFVNGAVGAVMLFASPTTLEDTDHLCEVFSLIGAELGKVAERTALQGRVHQAQKMEAVGQLAAGVAHEINNPMSYVRSNLHTLRQEWDALRSKLPSEEDERMSDFEELIDESLEGVERTIAIVRDVKEFSHTGVIDRKAWKEVRLSDLLDGAQRVAAPQAAAGVQIEATHRDTACCRCSENQIRQVFVNLIVNAIQAVGRSGTVRLSTGVEGNEVFARVEDDGPGMTEGTRNHLFDPFFTTKPVGEGTGLGLSVSYEIVRNHGGEILVHSEPGAGACFEVRLPIDPD